MPWTTPLRHYVPSAGLNCYTATRGGALTTPLRGPGIRSRLFNTSTLVTLTLGALTCYLALYAVNLARALFVLDPAVMAAISTNRSALAACSC